MSTKKYKYPSFFPTGCPPTDAISKKLTVYRLIEENTVRNSDFKSFIEEGRDARNPKLPYVEYGLSVNTNYEEIKKFWRGNAALKKKYKSIAYGETYTYTGVIKATASKMQKNHYTWWLYKDVFPETFFKIK